MLVLSNINLETMNGPTADHSLWVVPRSARLAATHMKLALVSVQTMLFSRISSRRSSLRSGPIPMRKR